MICKTCNDSKVVYTVAYVRMAVPIATVEGAGPAPVSFSIEQVIVHCPDCNRAEFPTMPAPSLG